VWYLNKNISSIEFPINLNQVQQKFLDSLIKGNEELARSIIIELLSSDINKIRILVDVILSSLSIMSDLYNRGKIGETDRLYIYTVATDIVTSMKFAPYVDNIKNATSLSIASSEESIYLGKIASVALYLLGWNSYYLGNVESKIDPFFDIDIQRFVLRKFQNSKGIVVITIFSSNENSLRFLVQTLKSLKPRISSDLRIAIFTQDSVLSFAQTLESDHVSTNINELLNWLESEYNEALSDL
jgi:hypothetical protein